MRRVLASACSAAAVVVALALAPAAASAASGDLSQLSAADGCVSQDGTGGDCADGKGLGEPRSVAVSPDGENVYVASPFDEENGGGLPEAVSAYARDGSTGALTQLAGTSGCVSEDGTGGDCADGRTLGDPIAAAVSPDGDNVYVASQSSDGLAVFDRDQGTGALSQLAGASGCVSRGGSGGCSAAEGLSSPQSVTVSPDGAHVYVASAGSSSVEVFARDSATGALTQLAGQDGCISDSGSGGACADGRAMRGPSSVTVSPDGGSVYATAADSAAVTILDRDETTGEVTQPAGTAGCVSETGSSGQCADGKALAGPAAAAVAADGSSLYVASQGSDALAVFDRSQSGALTQRAGAGGCVSETGAGPCTDGKALDGVFSVAVSSDGSTVYSAAFVTNGVAVLDRGPANGELTPRSGSAGCVTEDGTNGNCADGKALDDASSIALSSDGRSAYVGSSESHAVAVFERETEIQTTITAGPTGATSDATPTLEFVASEAGATFECKLDADSFAPCESPVTTASLADGEHTFSVRATDGEGNPDSTPASRTFTVDTAAPDTTLDGGPSGTTDDPTPTFDFSSGEAGTTFQCRVDSAAFQPCSSPTTTAELADGPHTFEVRAVDGAGNVDQTPASRSITVAVPPETSITNGPSGTTGDATPTFEFQSSEAGSSFECRVDTAVFEPCSTPHTTAELSDGDHTFEVRAVDGGGTTDPSPDSRSFEVDTERPDTTFDSGPDGLTSDSTPTFGFDSSESGSTFECRVDTAAFASCSDPHTTGQLTDGAHTFEVRATDAAGNADDSPAQRGFEVDTNAPSTAITSSTDDPTDVTPTFEFEAGESGSTFECRVDGAAFAQCSSPHTTDALGEGDHRFEVRATDPAGNADQTPAAEDFAIDTGPPETSITAAPQATSSDSTPEFGFSSSEAGSTFECRRDGAGWESCESPKALGTVSDGLHSFEVRAVDRFGNTDGSPAAHIFLVDTQGPAMEIDDGTVKVRKGVAKVGVTCPGGEPSGPCTGELELKTAEKVKVGKDKRKVTLGTADFSAPAGETDAAAVKLSKSNRELVEDLGKVRVTATADAEDVLGNEQRSKGELTLKAG